MNKRTYRSGILASCAAIVLTASPAYAQENSALMSALVKKGILSNKEAEDILASEKKDYETPAASKINLPSSIKNITFYGDLRLRYEMRDGNVPDGYISGAGTAINGGHGDSETLNRWRYRLRFGLKGNLYDNFFFGIRAATNPNFDRSGNVTLGHSDAAGPFGKDQNLLALDQVYLGWHAPADFTFTGGQMPNPLYTTSMVWSDDLNPTGAAENWDHAFNNLEVFATAGQYVYQAASGNGVTNTIGGNSNFPNTFMYVEQAGFKDNFDDNTFFKAAATFYSYSGTKSTSATSVAGLYSTSPIVVGSTTSPAGQENNSPSYFNGPFVGAAPAPASNVSGINDLAVLEVPMEFDFKIGPGVHHSISGDSKDMKDIKDVTTGWVVPIRIFGDVAYNVEADDRADQAREAIESAADGNFVGSASTGNVGITLTNSSPGKSGTGMTAGDVATNKAELNSPAFAGVLNSGKGVLDQTAYQVGIEAGQLKQKGDWDGKLFWQSTGYYALDPNLVDADIFNSATNMQGAVISAAYNWTDGLSSTLRYSYATQVNDKLATPNVNQDLQIGTIQHYNLFQADLMWKF